MASMQLASVLDGIPVVTNATTRDTQFPSPQINQRVQRLDQGTVERWTGAAWTRDQLLQETTVTRATDPLYGAAGDGVTDDTAALQAAMDATYGAYGGIVDGGFLTYKISAPLQVPANTRFGVFRNAVLTVAGDTEAFGGVDSGAGAIFQFHMDTVLLIATSHTTVGRTIIDFSTFSQSYFRNVWFLGVDGKSVGFYGNQGVAGQSPYGNRFELVYGGGFLYGFHADDGGTASSGPNSNVIDSSRLQPASGATAFLGGQYTQAWRILNTIIEHPSGGTGITYDGDTLDVAGCRFEGLAVGLNLTAHALRVRRRNNYFSSCTVNEAWAATATPPAVDAVGGDRGDADVVLVATDARSQRFDTTLTANRTVTLPTTSVGNGDRFRITRTGLGAFTLDVGGLKTIPSGTAAWVDVVYDGSDWLLEGYGTL